MKNLWNNLMDSRLRGNDRSAIWSNKKCVIVVSEYFLAMTKVFNSVHTDGEKGYVAIATVIVVGFVMLAVGMGVTLNSINEIQSSFSDTQKEESIGFVESCIQEVLLDINKTDTAPATVILPDGTCTVTINSHVGSNWDFTVTGTYLGYKKTIRVTATRTTTVTVTSWIEI